MEGYRALLLLALAGVFVRDLQATWVEQTAGKCALKQIARADDRDFLQWKNDAGRRRAMEETGEAVRVSLGQGTTIHGFFHAAEQAGKNAAPNEICAAFLIQIPSAKRFITAFAWRSSMPWEIFCRARAATTTRSRRNLVGWPFAAERRL